jgi:hypothetical protein
MRSLFKSVAALALITFLFAGCTKEYITNIVTGPAPTVEAGNSQTIQLPINSVDVTGTVTKSSSKIVGYLWSQVSGPNVPEIATESSTTTKIKGLVEGKYVFQFLAIDSAGLTGVDTLSVTVKPVAIQTLTLQPKNNPTEFQIISIFGLQDQNPPEFNAAAWTWQGTPGVIRGYFKFDLSGIPANATILSAKLSLYSTPNPINGNLSSANSGTDNAFYIQRITNSWDQMTMTWQTQPSVETANQVLIPHTNEAFLDLVDVNVKEMVSRMHTINNYGFMIRLQNEVYYNNRNFCSSEHANAAKHPKLVITYQQ